MFKAAYASALLNAFLMTMQIAIGMTAHSDGRDALKQWLTAMTASAAAGQTAD